MSGGFLAASVLKDLRRYRRDPWSLLSWLGIPVLIGLLLSMAFGGGDGAVPRAKLLVVDRDDSFLSGLLVGALGSDRLDIVDASSVDEETGRKRIDGGDASALLVLPEGFGEAVLRETPVTLELVTNPSQRILPGIVEELLSMLADAVFYLHRVLGDELRTLAGGPAEGQATFGDAEIAAMSVRINGIVERLVPRLNPPAIQVTRDASQLDEPETAQSFGRLFLPGILVMALLFMSQGLAGDIWLERELHTLRRIVTAPPGVYAVLTAKVLAAAVIIFVVCALAILLARTAYDVPLLAVPGAVIWATLTGLMLLALQLVIHVHAASSRTANLVSMAVIFPLMMLGGSFFPFALMPSWMAAAGRLTPNGWALVRLEEIAWGTPAVGELLAGGAGLVVLTLALLVLTARRVEKTFATG